MPPSNRPELYRAAIIGCGNIAGGFDDDTGPKEVRTHAKAYEQNKKTRLIAAMDIDDSKASAFAKRWKCKPYNDVNEMILREPLDFLSIASPDETHAAYLKIALQIPGIKAVWCEKPLPINGAESLVKAYEDKGIALVVNYQRRWDPGIRQVSDRILAGDLGTIHEVRVRYSGGLLHAASHALDLLGLWLGSETQDIDILYRSPLHKEDVVMHVKFKLGSTSIQLIPSNTEEVFDIIVRGNCGSVHLKEFGTLIEWDMSLDELPRGSSHSLENNKKAIAMSHGLEEMIQHIEGNGPLSSSGRTALHAVHFCNELQGAFVS